MAGEHLKLISWNVNGIRAVLRKGFRTFFETENPDILCLQETKAGPELVDASWAFGYYAFWNAAQRPGYSGTAIFSREKPLAVTYGLAIEEHDGEGRVITAEYDSFFLINVYVPNSKRQLERLAYRQKWDRDFLAYLQALEARKPVVVCGDFNVAHTELDLARPKQSIGEHGFTDEERAGFSAFVSAGLVDTFREFEKGGEHYTWWSPVTAARSRNVGWRIDYFLISAALRPRLKSATILHAVGDSDHCPIAIELAVSAAPVPRKIARTHAGGGGQPAQRARGT